MTHEKSETLKLSHTHIPHRHVPHYHAPHNHKHDFSNLGNGLASAGTLLASNAPAAAGMGSTLATIAVVAIPVVVIGGLIWWAASQDE
ncbi:MAG: hypothetical protein EAZ78_08535 [Oscillatoriales cyanobacterium]|uniref:hypothetical protein n=1 Tax=Microcoleus anatoxicus TaxID=2705319 RepID=UPI002975FEE6|nr:MAG: hypothetical protein EA000_24925 [Oscillatoriales cyanobacterium]TAF04597.1 MAG: hypothetical protein EAZ78_08535 [Oscillatoriales cyanobacterium]TAF46912.1 MAG: hypothetical protein EAZ68_02900 [Oscillatoriales cyanobacterium]TAF64233.1 MAG: hypothetical protein EAZ59_18890 [Oscillatoriales cyanobacterium]